MPHRAGVSPALGTVDLAPQAPDQFAVAIARMKIKTPVSCLPHYSISFSMIHVSASQLSQSALSYSVDKRHSCVLLSHSTRRFCVLSSHVARASGYMYLEPQWLQTKIFIAFP
jgi:hypothetical protein